MKDGRKIDGWKEARKLKGEKKKKNGLNWNSFSKALVICY